MGVFQDSLIGTSEITRSKVKMNKWHAMSMFSNLDPAEFPEETFDFNKFQDNKSLGSRKFYTGREIISKILPKVNLKGKKPKFYMEQFESHLKAGAKYDPNDINVEIDRGELKTGILDKSTVGQGVKRGLFDEIKDEYGAQKTLDIIYAFHQVVSRFLLYSGFSTGIKDINVSEKATKEIKEKTAAMIVRSREITDKLNKGKLVAPIGMTLKEFYEEEQLIALTPGDGFVLPIIKDTNIHKNSLMKLVFTGSKGKPLHIIAINGAIGTQEINGKRPGDLFGYGRKSPFTARYDMEPKAAGFIETSFKEGVQSDVFWAIASEARHGLISNALSTSITGYQNRISIKNLESIVVDNLRKSYKETTGIVVQPLYAEDGLDPRKTRLVKFPTIMLSNKEMEERYHTKLNKIPAKYRNKKTKEMLDEEFNSIMKDRDFYREIHLKIEKDNRFYKIEDKHFMPVDVKQVIDNIVYSMPSKKEGFNPVKAIEKIKTLCKELPYVFWNYIQKAKKTKLPKYLISATNMMQMIIRSYLNTSYLISKNVSDTLLDAIIKKIELKYKSALADYGMAVGIIAAQSVSEPMTQFVLDSKHRSGLRGGTKTNAIVRVKEIFGAKSTDKMKNPSMLLMVSRDIEKDEEKVKQIANYIEMMSFDQFVHSEAIFAEKYGEILHDDFKHEMKLIKQFEKYHPESKPSNLTNWVIRFVLDKEQMILKSMDLETIINVIKKKFPDLHLVYSPENADEIIIRCYIKISMVSKVLKGAKANIMDFDEDIILGIINNIKKLVIRGVDGILNTEVIPMKKSEIDPKTGEIKTITIYAIDTDGVNMKKILTLPFIDRSRSQTDSVLDIERFFGIEAARNKIISEIRGTMSGVSKSHCTLFADEMTYSGKVTSIHRTGLQVRERPNVSLLASFQTPIQIIEHATVNTYTSRIEGISGPLLVGKPPNIGTIYNKTYVNRKFIQENRKIRKLDDLI